MNQYRASAASAGIVAPLWHGHKIPSGVGTFLVAQTLSGHRLHAVTYDDIRK